MKTNYEIANEVLCGLWGNGEQRKQQLTNAGYNYESIQSIVNALVYDGSVPDAALSPKESEPEIKYLSIDFDTSVYQGIEINLIIGRDKE